MTSFFQKKYVKISVSCLLIFIFIFQFFPAPQKTQAVKAVSKINAASYLTKIEVGLLTSLSDDWKATKIEAPYKIAWTFNPSVSNIDAQMKRLVEGGFNIVQLYDNYYRGTKSYRDQMSEASQKYQIGLMPFPGWYGSGSYPAERMFQERQNDPAIWGWQIGEEPKSTGVSIDNLKRTYSQLKSYNPEWKAFVAHGDDEWSRHGYAVCGTADVFGTDIYPMIKTDPAGYIKAKATGLDYDTGTQKLIDQCGSEHVPVIMAWAYDQWTSPEGIRIQYDAWKEVINRGPPKGLAYYLTSGFLPEAGGDINLWNKIVAMNKSLGGTTGVISTVPPLSPTPAPAPTPLSSPPSPTPGTALSPINYLDLCEPKVPFYDEALQTDELQEACYLLKKIQDRAAQIVTIARKMYESTDPLNECNPLWGEKFPYITEGNCKSSCVWGLPDFTVGVDLTVLIACAVAPQLCAALAASVAKVVDLINKILKWKWVWDLWKLYKFLKALYEIYEGFTELLEDLDTLKEKIKELIESVSGVDLSELNEFYDSLLNLMILRYEIQGELTKIEGKIYQMVKTVGRFTPDQFKGIFRLINEIGDIFADKILAPEQSLGEGFVAETLGEMKQAADNLTCGDICDEIETLIAKIITKNDAIQMILYEFFEKPSGVIEERLDIFMKDMLGVICQTKGMILSILSNLTKLENEISQASDSNYLNIIQSGIHKIKPTFEELSDIISQLESGEVEKPESCEGKANGESCGDSWQCFNEKCMEYYWKKTGFLGGTRCLHGAKNPCTSNLYGETYWRYGGSENELPGSIELHQFQSGCIINGGVYSYKCERKEAVQEEEPWPPEEVCRLNDHFSLLEKLWRIIFMIRATSKKVDEVIVDLDASDEQIRKDAQIIRERLEQIKNELDAIREDLVAFGVTEEAIDEAKAEIDELKPKIDELEETALQAMGVINLLKGIKLIKEIIDLLKEIYQEAQELVDKIIKVLEGETGGDLDEILKKIEDFKKEIDAILKKVRGDWSIEISDLREGIRCLPASGIYGEFKAEDSKEIVCPMPAWWREEACDTNDDDDCDEDRVCRAGICRKKCDTDDNCDPNYICEEEACIPPSASKYIGGRVCPDLKVTFSQLSGAFTSILSNFNKIRDIERKGNPEVAPVVSKASQLWERALNVQAWAAFQRHMTDNCSCGRSYCRLTFGVSGISFPGTLDPLLNPYCWLAWWPGRNWLRDEADKLENANRE